MGPRTFDAEKGTFQSKDRTKLRKDYKKAVNFELERHTKSCCTSRDGSVVASCFSQARKISSETRSSDCIVLTSADSTVEPGERDKIADLG